MTIAKRREGRFARRRVRHSFSDGRSFPSFKRRAKSGNAGKSGVAAIQDSLGRSPISVNLRSLRLYVEDLSRRDSVKVAQYEVLGNDAKRHVRPGRDDRKRPAFGLARRSAIANFRSIVPSASGTDSSLKTLTQHFVLGYFH
jgi:hypothetical protein